MIQQVALAPIPVSLSNKHGSGNSIQYPIRTGGVGRIASKRKSFRNILLDQQAGGSVSESADVSGPELSR